MGDSVSESFMRSKWRCHEGLIIWRLDWNLGSTFKMAHNMAIGPILSSLLAVGRKPQFLPMWISPSSSLSAFMTWQLAFPRMSDPFITKTQKSNTSLCYILFVRSLTLSIPHVRGRELSSTFWREKCQRHCGCILRPLQWWFTCI